jgi:glycosyltransferase involved in cell wall biosynthesis
MDDERTYPLITIGLTCYNAADTISRALRSALGQDWPNFEVLIVDDVSSDQSADLVEKAIADESRARLIRHAKNTGPAGARNTILSHARGEYVAFFDDDDKAMPHRIRDQVEAISKCEEETGACLVACYAAGRRQYDNGYVMDLPAIGIGGDEMPHGPGIAAWLLYYQRKPEWNYGSGMPACSLMAPPCHFPGRGWV